MRWEWECRWGLDMAIECAQGPLPCGTELELRMRQVPATSLPPFYPTWNSEKFSNSMFELGLSHCKVYF